MFFIKLQKGWLKIVLEEKGLFDGERIKVDPYKFFTLL